MSNLPDQYRKDKTGGEFLRYMDWTDEANGKLMMIFISDNGKFILENSSQLCADGTFDTAPSNFFKQVYIILGNVGDGRMLPAAFCLLPDKVITLLT